MSSPALAKNAAAILAIPLGEPERLFTGQPDTAKAEYRELAKLWHPDRNAAPEADSVFAHINALFEAALKKLTDASWGLPEGLELRSKEGKLYRFNYRAEHPFELGRLYIGSRHVLFLIDRKYEDFVLRGLRAIGSVRYPDNRMRSSMEVYFPKVEKVIEVVDAYAVVLNKTDDVVLLKDLHTHLKGNIDPKHTAWIISSLLSLVCFLEITHRTHNGLAMDSVFVSPKYHSVVLLGGWWYAVDAGKELKTLPPFVHRVTPRRIAERKTADIRIDLESIRAIGRSCLSVTSPGQLRLRTDVPKPFADWLTFAAPKSAIADYKAWEKVLTDSFGPRRFITLSGCSGDDIYPPRR